MTRQVVKEGSYVSIQAFMVNELHLSGNELITYAVIYGFSQDGQSWFTGSRGYLAGWCQTSEKSVTNNLKKLLERGLIRKRQKVEHGCTFNDYQAVQPASTLGKKVPSTGEKSSLGSGEESSLHTIEGHTTSGDTSIPYSEIVEYLNGKAGTRYKASTPRTREHIRARWLEGFRLADFKAAIDAKCSDWLGTDMEKYLRPETLFGTKMEGYANQPVSTRKNGVSNGIPEYLREYSFERTQDGDGSEKVPSGRDEARPSERSVSLW